MAQRSDRPTEPSSQSLSNADVEKAKQAIKYLSSLDLPEASGSSHSEGSGLSSGSSSSGSSRPGTGSAQRPHCYCVEYVAHFGRMHNWSNYTSVCI